MHTGDGSSVVPEELAETLCEDPAVEFALAFGSRVSGELTPASDVDIAIKFADHCTPGERFRKRVKFAGRLEWPDDPPIDLSDLEELPLEVAHVAVTGEFLCGDERTFESFKHAIEAEFAEREAEIEARHRDVIRRIANEGLHG